MKNYKKLQRSCAKAKWRIFDTHFVVKETMSRRLCQLAEAKPLPAGFVDDRRSVYWDNSIQKDWSEQNCATKHHLSKRLEQLVRPKRVHKEWQGDRLTSIWTVSSAAQTAVPSNRLSQLARPKKRHPDFQAEKSVISLVSDAARNAEASDRLVELSTPKTYGELLIKPDSDWDWGVWKSEIPDAALRCTPSERIVRISMPKKLHKDYKETRPVIWQVPLPAKKALPSIRIQQLSRPKSRTQYKEDYNPNCWDVSQAAKNATATPRLDVLSTPLPRKLRAKKGGGAKA